MASNFSWADNGSMFQSLFFWNHHLYGNAVLFRILHREQFQSLFFWNHHLYPLHQEPIIFIPGFQSLFFWNHHLYIALKNPPAGVKSFNPCFSGTTTYTPPAWWSGENSAWVSILVFLEPPLIHHFSDKYLKFRILHPTHSASFSSCSAQIECIFCQFYAGFACLCWS